MDPHQVGALFAHQGGWDEIIMVAAPIALFAVAMRAANGRARRVARDVRLRLEREAREVDEPVPDPPAGSDAPHVDAER